MRVHLVQKVSRKSLAVLVFVGLLVVPSCSSAVTEIPASEFRNYGDTPLEHTIYIGSDQDYHYFVWSYGKSGGRWKIRKSEMPFIREFELDSQWAFLVTAPDGSVQPYIPTE